MQQSFATPFLHLGFWGLRKIVACSQSSSQCLLVSTVFGTVSSLHPTSFLMIFTLVHVHVPPSSPPPSHLPPSTIPLTFSSSSLHHPSPFLSPFSSSSLSSPLSFPLPPQRAAAEGIGGSEEGTPSECQTKTRRKDHKTKRGGRQVERSELATPTIQQLQIHGFSYHMKKLLVFCM